MNFKQRKKEIDKINLPKDWRYNVSELRMEKKVPVYDENEKYSGHMWCALVPDDIKEFISQSLSDYKKELGEETRLKLREWVESKNWDAVFAPHTKTDVLKEFDDIVSLLQKDKEDNEK